MRHLLGGMRLVFGDRKLWPYVWGPMGLAAAAYLAIGTLAYLWLAPLAQRLLAGIGLGPAISALLGGIAFGVVWWMLSTVLYFGLAGILSSFLWERLSHEVEVREGTLPDATVKLGCAATVYDTALRAALSVVVAIMAVLFGWCLFGLPVVVLAGWLGLLDFSACAFARRGVLLDRQLSAVRKCPGWAGFMIGAGIVALFPVANVVMLPALVAGGTLLCALGEAGAPFAAKPDLAEE